MEIPSADADKARWRNWARKRRRQALSPEACARLLEHLATWPRFEQATHVLSYLPLGSEVDLTPLHQLPHKRFYVTRIPDGPERLLTVHELVPQALELHAYGVRQPRSDAVLVPIETIELVLVPGLAFDARGARLGYGGGYYDRLLGRFPPGVPLVGICPAALLVPRLPSEDHDVPVSHLATEEGIVEARALDEA